MSGSTRPNLWYWLRSLLLKRVGFVGQTTWQLEQTTLGVEARQLEKKEAPNFPIVLVGRSLCYEQVKHIPVESWLEARRIARHIPVSSPFDGARKVRLIPEADGGYKALITIINTSKLNACLASSARALIPVSWLASALADGQAGQIELAHEPVGFSPTQTKGVTMLLNSEELRRDYWWALGIDPMSVRVVTHEECLERLIPASASMGLTGWVEAFSHNGLLSSLGVKELEWRRAGSLVGIIAATYMVAVSLLLAGAETMTSAAADEESSDFSKMLTVRKELNLLIDRQDQWERLKGEQYPVWSIWPVVKDVAGGEVLVRSIVFDNGTVEATFLAKDATEVLETIVANTYTSNVESVTGTRIDRSTGLNEFTVSWDVVDEAHSEAIANADG